MDELQSNQLRVQAIRTSLNFIKDYLQIIKEKIPSDLSEEELNTTFQTIKEKFGDTFYKDKKIKEPAQIYGAMSLGSLDAILCTLESRLREDDGTSWCGMDQRVHEIRTVKD